MFDNSLRIFTRSRSLPQKKLSFTNINLERYGISKTKQFVPKNIFKNKFEIFTLEIGFGDGEHLLNKAKNNRQEGFIGCEYYLQGYSQLLEGIENNLLSNIKVFPYHALLFLRNCIANSFSKIFLLFPDPWPKNKHIKRRFICEENITLCSKILIPGGDLIVMTDKEEYLQYAKKIINSSYFDIKDQQERQPYMETPVSKYERKAFNCNNMTFYVSFKNNKLYS